MTTQPPPTDSIDSAQQPAEVAPIISSATPLPGHHWRMIVRVVLLVGLTVIVSAFNGAFIGQKLVKLYKEQMHLSVNDLGTLGLILGIPSYFQWFVGAWSDLYPLFGYHRRSYYILATLIEAAALYALATLHRYTYIDVVCLILIVNAGGILLNVMVNAVMVAVGNLTGTIAQLQSVISFIPLILGILWLSSLRGYVAQNWSYYACFASAALLCLLRAPCAFLIDERRVTRARHVHESAEEHAARLAARKAERARTVTALKQAAASPGLWVMVGFIFYLIITPGINNAIYYYERDVLRLNDQVIGNLGRPQLLGTLAGILMFGLTARWLPIRAMVWGAWVVDCLSYPILLLLHPGPNMSTVIFMASVGLFCYGLVGVIYSLCLSTLAARASPPGIEGAVYGLVLAAISLAGGLSEKLGAFLYDYFGPKNPAHHYSITHGWNYALAIGFAFTVIGFVFIPFLPAWARSKEPIRPRKEELEAEKAV